MAKGRPKTDKTKLWEGIEALMNGDFTGVWEYSIPVLNTNEFVQLKATLIVGKGEGDVVKAKAA